ncbi:MAG: ATP-binding protein [Gallionella sp.]|nr:ATP-binding protein [Gallionella sp.]
MLIEFSVANFRSFRARQTLSMVAAPRLRKRENVFKPESAGEKFPDLLKVAVIYGPNASGKSNLLKALDVVKRIAQREPSTRNTPLPIAPFRFDAALADQPSLFELNFIHVGIRYQFTLSATSERIVGEKLLAYPKGQESLLYERLHSAKGESYEFGALLRDSLSAELLDAWQKLTPPKLLFIAQAMANSSEALTPLKVPFEWLEKSSFSLLNGMDAMADVAQELASEDEICAREIASFLRDVDVPIAKMTVEMLELPLVGSNALSKLFEKESNSINAVPIASKRTVLTHKTALGDADLSYEDESEGTKNLIGFWLPWITKDPSYGTDRLLIVDELDSSLHPRIVTALVDKHINSSVPSQLIFTTHDTHLMDAKLLRRDQFWITERDMNGATQLRSIHDFEGRESEDIEKRYYEGRYRGLPFVKRSA